MENLKNRIWDPCGHRRQFNEGMGLGLWPSSVMFAIISMDAVIEIYLQVILPSGLSACN